MDNRFKSYQNACMLFSDAVELFDDTLFGDLASAPTGNRLGSPREESEYQSSLFGQCSIPAKYDSTLLWLTSIPTERLLKPKGLAGIRYEERMYRSPELSAALRMSKPEEIRIDCVNPARMYIRIAGRVVAAFASDAQKLSALSECEQLFRSMTGKAVRSTNRRKRGEIHSSRHKRIARANASAAATRHLPDSAQQEPVSPNYHRHTSPRVLPSAFEIEGEDRETQI